MVARSVAADAMARRLSAIASNSCAIFSSSCAAESVIRKRAALSATVGGRTAPTGNTGLSTAEVCTLPNFVCTTVAMSTGRLFHTSTILVNNKVLIAGALLFKP